MRASFGQKLLKTARLFNEQALGRARARGHPLRAAQAQLLPHLDFDGTRLTDLASRAGMTKQSAAALVDEMVEAGYLMKRPDPADGRAKLVSYTPKGTRAVGEGITILGELEAELRDRVGAEVVNGLDQALDMMLAELDPEA